MEPSSQDTGLCFYCKSPEAELCPHCGLVSICKKESHRALHRGVKGNVIVAARDIRPFETIIIDRPAIIGPFDDTLPECLECFKEVSVDGYKCSLCNLPLCGPQCEGGPVHEPECLVLRRAKPRVSVTEQDSFNPVYSSVAPIRMLSVMKNKPEVWEMVDKLMDHLETRRKEPKWDFIRENVLPLIVDQCGFDVKPEVIERIIGIFRTNSVKWEKRLEDVYRPVGHALCPLFSVLCHSCVNNTRYTQTEAGEMIVRAVVTIRAGEEVTTQYRGPNTGNILRRLDFPTNWMFECECPRCLDPTELGTHASTIRCPACDKPSMAPTSSDMESPWGCGECGHSLTMAEVKDLTLKLELDLDTFSYAASPADWELLLERFESVLHENHYICMKTKRILLQIYGARDGWRLNQLTRKQLDRKIALCRNYIEIFSKLEPGFRVWKGRLLEELLGPLTMTLGQDQEEGRLAKIDHLLKYKEIMKMLREAAQCRQFEERNEKNDEIIGKYYQTWMKPLQSVATVK